MQGDKSLLPRCEGFGVHCRTCGSVYAFGQLCKGAATAQTLEPDVGQARPQTLILTGEGGAVPADTADGGGEELGEDAEADQLTLQALQDHELWRQQHIVKARALQELVAANLESMKKIKETIISAKDISCLGTPPGITIENFSIATPESSEAGDIEDIAQVHTLNRDKRRLREFVKGLLGEQLCSVQEEPDSDTTQVHSGEIVMFSDDRGFGFIRPNDGSDNVSYLSTGRNLPRR